MKQERRVVTGALDLEAYKQKPGALSSHGCILRWLERHPRESRILDVGTATGYLGASLRALGFSRVSGLESDPTSAEHARPHYASFTVANLESDALPWPTGSFTVIICADVLEHVRDPAAALKKLVPLLAPGGWLIASVPNIAHWSVRCGLLFGQFRYQSSGILDRTHLQFFTRATARELLQHADLDIVHQEPTPLPIAHWCNGSLWSPLWRAVERVDWCLATLRPSLFAYQLVLIGQRGSKPASTPSEAIP